MSFSQAVHGFLGLCWFLIGLALLVFGFIDTWMRVMMSQIGIPKDFQVAVLILVGVLFFVAAVRLLGGILRIALVVFLVLFILHLLVNVPHAHDIRNAPPHAALFEPWPKGRRPA